MDEEVDIPVEHHEQAIPLAQANAAGHSWRQHGPMLLCTSCPFEHSFTPTDHNGLSLLHEHTFHGMDEKGQPILKKR
jgi:hypothetical protein